MYLPNFLEGYDRLVAFDAETTGKRTPTPNLFASSLCLEAPGIIIEVGFVEMLREGEGWRKGETWRPRSTRMGQSTPRPSRSTGLGPPISRILHGSRRYAESERHSLENRRSWRTLTRTSEISSTMSSPGPR